MFGAIFALIILPLIIIDASFHLYCLTKKQDRQNNS
jgi:hypothetical protein